jgi:FkbM family methyltransferase
MEEISRSMPVSVRLAFWWAAHGIRGRSAVARAVGRWQSSDRPLFIKTRSGASLSVDYDNLDTYAPIYNDGGCWDANVMSCCGGILRGGDVFYDIGSNTGLFALDMAKSISNLTVFAFEPQPSLAQHIRRSIEENGFERVKVLEVLLGNEEGESSLFLTSHSIHASVIPREEHYRELRRPLRTLDGLVAAGESASPDVIKIDVEGSELRVFEGAETILKSGQPSIVFEADENMSRMGYSTDDLFRLLESAAPYKFFLIDGSGTPVPVARPYPLGNYLALSPRHIDRIRA